MPNLLNVTIAAALAGQLSPALQFRDGVPRNLTIQANFAYGSGGTSVDAWVQTTFDGGQSWVDVCNFHFLLANKKGIFNLSAATPVTTEYVPTDATLGADTAKDGIIGSALRVKWTSVGTYAGGTTLSISVTSSGRLQS